MANDRQKYFGGMANQEDIQKTALLQEVAQDSVLGIDPGNQTGHITSQQLNFGRNWLDPNSTFAPSARNVEGGWSQMLGLTKNLGQATIGTISTQTGVDKFQEEADGILLDDVASEATDMINGWNDQRTADAETLFKKANPTSPYNSMEIPTDTDGNELYDNLPQLDQLSLYWGIDKRELRELSPAKLSELIEGMPLHWNPKKQKAALVELYNQKTSNLPKKGTDGQFKYLNDKLITELGAKALKTTLGKLDGAYLAETKQAAQSMIVAMIQRLASDSSFTAEESEVVLNNLIESINFYDPELFTQGDYQNLVRQRAEEGVRDIAQYRVNELNVTLDAWESEGIPNLLLENVIKAIQTGSWEVLGLTAEEANARNLTFDNITTEQILDLVMPYIMATREDEADVDADVMLEEARWLFEDVTESNYPALRKIIEEANKTVAHDVILEATIRQRMKKPIQAAITGVQEQMDAARLEAKASFVDASNSIASNPMRPVPIESLVWDLSSGETHDVFSKKIDAEATQQVDVIVKGRFARFATDWINGGKPGGWDTVEHFLLKDQAIDEDKLKEDLATGLITPDEYHEAMSRDADSEQGIHTDRFLDHHFRPLFEAKWSNIQDDDLREKAITDDLAITKHAVRQQTIDLMASEAEAEAANFLGRITSGQIAMGRLNPAETTRRIGNGMLQTMADMIELRRTIANYPYAITSPWDTGQYINTDIELVTPPDSLPADSPLKNLLFILKNTNLSTGKITYEAVPSTDPLQDMINQLYGAIALQIQKDTDPNSTTTGLPLTSLIQGTASTTQVQKTMISTAAKQNQIKQNNSLLAQNPTPQQIEKIENANLELMSAIETDYQGVATHYNNNFGTLPSKILTDIARPGVYNDPLVLKSNIGFMWAADENGILYTENKTRDKIIAAAKIDNPFVGYLLEYLDGKFAYDPTQSLGPITSVPDYETQWTETTQDAISFALNASVPSVHLADLQTLMENTITSQTAPTTAKLTALNITTTPLSHVNMVFDAQALALGNAPGSGPFAVIDPNTNEVITGAGHLWWDNDDIGEIISGDFLPNYDGTSAFMQAWIGEIMRSAADSQYGPFMQWDQATANKVAQHTLHKLTKYGGWTIHRTPQEGGGQPYGMPGTKSSSRESSAFTFIHDPLNEFQGNLPAVTKTFIEQHQTPIAPLYDSNNPLMTTIDSDDMFNLLSLDSLPVVYNFVDNLMNMHDWEYGQRWKITDDSILDNITTGPLSQSWITDPGIRQMRADYGTMDPEQFLQIHFETLVNLDYDALKIPGTIHSETGDWISVPYEDMKAAYYDTTLYGNNAMRDVSTIPELVDTYYSITGEFPDAKFYNRDFYNLTEWDIMIYAINKAHRGKVDARHGDYGIDVNMIKLSPDSRYLQNSAFYEGIHFPPPGEDLDNISSRPWGKHKEGFPLVLEIRNKYNQPLRDTNDDTLEPMHVTRKIVTAKYGALATASDKGTPIFRANSRRTQKPFSIPTLNPNPKNPNAYQKIMNPGGILNQAPKFDYINNVGNRIMFQRSGEQWTSDTWEDPEWTQSLLVDSPTQKDRRREHILRPYDIFVIPPEVLDKDKGSLIIEKSKNFILSWEWDGDHIWIKEQRGSSWGGYQTRFWNPKNLVSPSIIEELQFEN
ncbi:hypothetical protein CL634_01125 [bacterium]|nr:hypothetical protein [bacterium]|tara:strand:+ start:721 stop:5643 length:4923 start_codon:yes stop_codon:yes gene_type:complete